MCVQDHVLCNLVWVTYIIMCEMQDTVNMEEEIRKINCSHPYVIMLQGNELEQYVIVCEHIEFVNTTSVTSCIFCLLALYYIFDIAYPPPLYSVFIFLQHFVFGLLDKQTVPDVVTRIVSVLQRLE